MKLTALASLALFACAPPAPASDPTLLLHVDALAEHIDRISLGLDALNAKVQAPPVGSAAQPATHVVCREKKLQQLPVSDAKKGDHELKAAPCAAPDEAATCLDGVALSTMAARCEAGKL